MSVMIQIRNVPDALHRQAKVRAAEEGLSLSDLALRALERELARPTPAEIRARIRMLAAVDCDTRGARLVREERDAR